MWGAAVTVLALSLLTAPPALACITCRPAVRAGIFDEHFWGRLSIAALPFLVILLVVREPAVAQHALQPPASG